jgi:hypothetical protein
MNTKIQAHVVRQLTSRELKFIERCTCVTNFTERAVANVKAHGRQQAINSLAWQARVGRDVAEFLIDEALNEALSI